MPLQADMPIGDVVNVILFWVTLSKTVLDMKLDFR